MEDKPAELARYLPLSMRPRYDETGVTGDWGPRLLVLLESVRPLLAATAIEPVDSIGLARSRLALALDAPPLGKRRTRIGIVGPLLADAYELARTLDRELPVDATLSGAVALARSLSAPLPIRAAIRDRTLVATDAGWEIGSGRALRATASSLVLFLYGRAGLPG
ncbi:hypothetical protein BH11ACT3_BH11ACT3_24800 [soil metagenome]